MSETEKSMQGGKKVVRRVAKKTKKSGSKKTVKKSGARKTKKTTKK